MFGRIRARRTKRKEKTKATREAFEKEKADFEKTKSEFGNESREALKKQAAEEANRMRQERGQARQEGRKISEEIFARKVSGLDPEQRQALESENQRKLNRDMQGMQRQLTAQQGRRGIKGGAAYAQNAELMRLADDAQRQFRRDITQLDKDIEMKKRAAMLGVEQGEAAQYGLDRQLALDEMNLERERQRQRLIEDQYNRLFTRI